MVYSAGWTNRSRFWSVWVHSFWLSRGKVVALGLEMDPQSAFFTLYQSLSLYFLCDPIMTLETKLTIALAGCSGSCSANRWHIFSVSVWDFLATNPKILKEKTGEGKKYLHKCQETLKLKRQFAHKYIFFLLAVVLFISRDCFSVHCKVLETSVCVGVSNTPKSVLWVSRTFFL